MEALEHQRYAPAALHSRRARATLWADVVHAARLGDPYRPDSVMVFSVVAILKAAGYRSAIEVAEQAVLEAKLRDFVVPPSVCITLKDARRAAQRAMGPPKSSAPIPVERIPELPQLMEPWHPQGPLWPARCLLVGCWWLLREVELASIAQREVTLTGDTTVTVLLSVSKTDPRALGAQRSHRCACRPTNSAPPALDRALCPACAVRAHLADLRSLDLAHPDAPLFPTWGARPVTKAGVVHTIRAGMARLGCPLSSASGAPRWGGHSMRVGGAQFLGRSGVEVSRIQALARHSSNAILGYLQGVHVQTMHNIAAEAGLARSLTGLREEVAALQSVVSRAHPDASSGASGSAVSTVWNPGTLSKIHVVRATDTSRTVCGWLWQSCPRAVPNPPTASAPTCARCRRASLLDSTAPEGSSSEAPSSASSSSSSS